MKYYSRIDGKEITFDQYTDEAIMDVLTTKIETRVFNREYGSEFPNLLGKPQTPSLKMKIMAAAHVAIPKWINWVKLHRANFEPNINGQGRFSLSYTRLDRPNSPIQTLSFGV